MTSGFLLYLVVAALLVLFWRHVRGLSFDALLTRGFSQDRSLRYGIFTPA